VRRLLSAKRRSARPNRGAPLYCAIAHSTWPRSCARAARGRLVVCDRSPTRRRPIRDGRGLDLATIRALDRTRAAISPASHVPARLPVAEGSPAPQPRPSDRFEARQQRFTSASAAFWPRRRIAGTLLYLNRPADGRRTDTGDADQARLGGARRMRSRRSSARADDRSSAWCLRRRAPPGHLCLRRSRRHRQRTIADALTARLLCTASPPDDAGLVEPARIVSGVHPECASPPATRSAGTSASTDA